MTAPETAGIRFDQWASAEDSTFEPFELAFPSCLSKKGCPFQPAALPECPPDIEAVSVAEARRIGESPRLPFSNRELFIRGLFFAPKTMTMLECGSNACCNRASGRFRLVDHPNDATNALTVASRSRRDALHCGGDDSLFCCGIASAEVIAFGRVSGQELIDPKLCRRGRS